MEDDHKKFPTPRQTRLALILGIPIAIVVGPRAVAWAVPEPVPFVTKTTLSSADLNANFKALTDAVTALETGSKRPVATVGAVSYSTGPTLFCGATGGQKGDFGGNAKGKALCEAVSGCSPTAHMCTSEEIARTAQLGKPITPGWYVNMFASGTSPIQRDCGGWTSTTEFGTLWAGVGSTGSPTSNACSTTNPILCCD